MPQKETMNLVMVNEAQSRFVMQALLSEANRQRENANQAALYSQHEKVLEAINGQALAEYLAEKFRIK